MSQTIAITGGTGFLGSAIVAAARQEGHRIIILSRAPERVRVQEGIEAAAWGAGAPPPACDAVINLAGETLGKRWTPDQKEKIMSSRRDGTRHLVDAIGARPEGRPAVLVSASAVGYYGARGEELLPEDAAPGSGFLAEVCQAWEREARRAEELGVRVVLLRIGIVIGKGGGALENLLLPFKLGVGGPLGSGRQWFPWVHRDDVAGLSLFALNHTEVQGPVNAVSPGIVRGTEFARQLGRVLHRPALLPMPLPALRLVVGEFANHLVESQHVVPAAAQAAGYAFRFPTLKGAFEEATASR